MPLSIVPNSYPRFPYDAYQQNYGRFSTFAGQVFSKRFQGPVITTSLPPFAKVAAEADVAVISYPITPDDTCECVTFPNADFVLAACNAELQWGLFQVNFTDGACYDVVFDEAEVFAQCPSGLAQTTEAYSQYQWCEYDLTNALTLDDATTKMKVASSGETKTASLRQETTAEVKKKGHTHVHLTVHRMLTLVLETVLALQAPWV